MSSVTARSSSAAQSSEVPTRTRLLRAAEALFAENGIDQTSTRSILRAAEQRNESALQYHFGGREGLIEALYEERGAQVGEERQRMLRELDEATADPSIRQLCEVALLPPVRLARRDPEFATFLKVVGQLAFLPYETLRWSATRYTGEAIGEVARRLRARLSVPDALADRRFELMHRMAALSLAQHALSDGPFEGREAELFFDTLLDAMAAVLEGPMSESVEREFSAS